MNKNLEAPNAQTLFEKIFHYDYDLGFALNEIEKLQLSNIYFFNDFLREFNNQYLDIFDAVTQEDIDLLINNYKDVEPPHVWLDDFQFKAFYPFIKEYNNGLYISNKNVTGIKPSSDKMYKVYKFSDMLSEIYPNIIFEKFSFEDRFKNLNLFFELEQTVIKLQKSLVLPLQQTEKLKPEPKETELSERIKKHFGFFNRNCPRKHKQILNDTDFEKLIEWTIWYFENDFKVPEISEPIKVVNTNKTFVQLAFKYLFKELHKSSPYPETLFEFYQSAFAPFSEDKKSNFEAVQNKDEVKKLMQIDY